jgi:hypothetical protein
LAARDLQQRDQAMPAVMAPSMNRIRPSSTTFIRNKERRHGLSEGTMSQRLFIAAAFGAAILGSLAVPSGPSKAAPILGPTQVTSSTSPVVGVDRRCGPGRRYIGRHRVRGRDGRLHWVGGQCVRAR